MGRSAVALVTITSRSGVDTPNTMLGVRLIHEDQCDLLSRSPEPQPCCLWAAAWRERAGEKKRRKAPQLCYLG